MICSICGSGNVEWKGPLVALTHTECADCGGTNCQEVEEYYPEEYEEENEEAAEEETPCIRHPEQDYWRCKAHGWVGSPCVGCDCPQKKTHALCPENEAEEETR